MRASSLRSPGQTPLRRPHLLCLNALPRRAGTKLDPALRQPYRRVTRQRLSGIVVSRPPDSARRACTACSSPSRSPGFKIRIATLWNRIAHAQVLGWLTGLLSPSLQESCIAIKEKIAPFPRLTTTIGYYGLATGSG